MNEIYTTGSKVWVTEKPLDEVIVTIHKKYLSDPKLVDGETIGLLAKRLISCELEVGGPYVSKDNIYINTLIFRLFKLFGSPLNNLELFLKDKELVPKNESQRIAINLPIKYNKASRNKATNQLNVPIRNARREMEELDLTNKVTALNFIKKIVSSDKNSEISLISSYILNSLIKTSSKSDIEISYTLGTANVYAWIAYTIYDDFIDGEGTLEYLSLANIMHRHAYEKYRTEFPNSLSTINSYFDSVDNSNLWELKNCRASIVANEINIDSLPDYENGIFLAKRSIGHILGPILLISKSGLTEKQKKLTANALNQYLIAKQINDDIRDWKDDLRNGYISYVVAKLLKSFHINGGTHKIETLITHLGQIYWDFVLEECLSEVQMRLMESENCIKESKLFKNNNEFILNVIRPIQAEVKNHLKKLIDDKDFLKSYTQ